MPNTCAACGKEAKGGIGGKHCVASYTLGRRQDI